MKVLPLPYKLLDLPRALQGKGFFLLTVTIIAKDKEYLSTFFKGFTFCAAVFKVYLGPTILIFSSFAYLYHFGFS